MKNFIILLLLLMNSIQCMELEVAVDEMPQVTAQIEDPSVFLPTTRIYYTPSNPPTYTAFDNGSQTILKGYESFEQSIKDLVDATAYISVDDNTDVSLYKTPPPKNSSEVFTLVLSPTLNEINIPYDYCMQKAIDIAIQNSPLPIQDPLNAILLKAYWKVFKNNYLQDPAREHKIETEYWNSLKERYEATKNEAVKWSAPETIAISEKFITPVNKFLENKLIDKKSKMSPGERDDAIYEANKQWFIDALFSATPSSQLSEDPLLTNPGNNWQFNGRAEGWGYIVYLLDLFLHKDQATANMRWEMVTILSNLFNIINEKNFLALITVVFAEKEIPFIRTTTEDQEFKKMVSVETINQFNYALLKSMYDTRMRMVPINWDELAVTLKTIVPVKNLGNPQIGPLPSQTPQLPQTGWKQYIPHFVVTAATLIGSIGVAIKNWNSIQQWGWVQRLMQKMRRVNK
jgi:hypothetical protein